MQQRQNTKILFIGFICACISGCSLTPLQQDFSCPHKDGEPCLSISQADQKVLDKMDDKNDKLPIFNIYPYPSFLDPEAPIRRPDVVTRIWLAPFEDKDGNWHAPSTVYAVIKPSHWVPEGVKSENQVASEASTK